MHYLSLLSFAVAAASALSINPTKQQPLGQDALVEDQYLLELSPGKTRWVSEDEKWELKRNNVNFFDITATGHTYPHVALSERATVTYPSKPAYNDTVKPLLKTIKQKNMKDHLETFTAFHTRYYKSDYGIQSAEWLLKQVNDTIVASGADKYGASASKFPHPWGQFSIIARIPGKSNKTVIVSAHQDSINMFLPAFLAAPGADDDGSGTVTILEALRVVLQSKDIINGNADNTIEFHWYSAEEGGLLGSQAVFESYFKTGKDVKAMLQQDMTGYVDGTIKAGKTVSVGVITDFVNPALTTFIKAVIEEYCDIPWVETKCGYACSDHASASKYGYPSAFVVESEFNDSDKKIHTTEDKIEYLSFEHMEQHCRMTTAFVYEVAMAKF